ncbi:hypothetical protein [Persicobacter psychrovividus]|uniref:Uncharacterized protein n=1 Tax=Persicobacter psychrovividus TaxID=387638 RepID=A0ABN6LGL5_9BACT|nr:hypothetical protein PEPS_27570 [Persicobacter psychrovividus]
MSNKNIIVQKLEKVKELNQESLQQAFFATVRKPSCLPLDKIPSERMKVAVLNQKLTDLGILTDQQAFPFLNLNNRFR